MVARHASCSQDITQQPFNPFALNHRYASRAAQIFGRFSPTGSGADAGKPFLLYVAFAHTHTPLAYHLLALTTLRPPLWRPAVATGTNGLPERLRLPSECPLLSLPLASVSLCF
eukprot:COSAG01_NODE_677_length_14312_cov_10.195314_4_plen_114_part_00